MNTRTIMTNLTRRSFTALAGASLVPLFAPGVLGQGKPKLVVIGGGPGGGTVARYVNKDHKGAIDVTLVEPQKKFTTCFFSNIYVGGYRSFASITHGYDKVRKRESSWCTRPRRRSIATSARSCSPAASAFPMTASLSRPGSTSSSTRCRAIRKRPRR
jgi:hypothetical protein